jgi:hypothetical protein
MAAMAQPSLHLDSERARRRRDRHARLATDRALAEVAFELRAHERQQRAGARGPVADSGRTLTSRRRPVTDRAPRRRVAASSR